MKSPRVTSSETVILHVVMPKALAERHGLALVGTVPAVPAAPVEERPFSIIDGTPVPYSLTVRCARPCCKNGDDVQAVNHLVDIQDFLQRARPSQKLIRFEGAYAFYGEPYVPGALEAPKLLNTRVPQPNRETADYGVPPFVVDAAAVLYHHRNACPEEEIEIVDQAIVRLYQPWIRKSIGGAA